MDEKLGAGPGAERDPAVRDMLELLFNFAVAVGRTHPAPDRLLAEFRAEEAATTLARAGITDPTPAMREAEWARKIHAEALFRVLEHRLGQAGA